MLRIRVAHGTGQGIGTDPAITIESPGIKQFVFRSRGLALWAIATLGDNNDVPSWTFGEHLCLAPDGDDQWLMMIGVHVLPVLDYIYFWVLVLAGKSGADH